MVVVAALAASAGRGPPLVTMTATRRRTRSSTSNGRPVVSASSPSKFDCYILALDIAGLTQSLPESNQIGHVGLGQPGAKVSDHRAYRLLRARHERPHSCRAAK
jgi:hypothetical protein